MGFFKSLKNVFMCLDAYRKMKKLCHKGVDVDYTGLEWNRFWWYVFETDNVKNSPMYKWAENECNIAMAHEAEYDSDSDEELDEYLTNYSNSCYNSALFTYRHLLMDDHSGASYEATTVILKRLLHELPLTPIEDVPKNWEKCSFTPNDSVSEEYQCVRRSALFKSVCKDGSIKYGDVDRVVYVDSNNHTWHSGLADRIVNELYPIEFPYKPGKPYYVYGRQYLTDRKNGDWDTDEILYIKTPDGKRVNINKYFFGNNEDGTPHEITKEEFLEKKKLHNARVKAELKEEAKKIKEAVAEADC